MKLAQPGLPVSILTVRMTAFLLNMFECTDTVKAHGGLPAGAIRVPEARLILATTCCDKPLFWPEMQKAATEQNADIILMRHALIRPEEDQATTFDVVLNVNGSPCLISGLVLYVDRYGQYSFVPSGNGAFISIDADGLRLLDEPPFITWDERCDGVCRAAKHIKLASRARIAF